MILLGGKKPNPVQVGPPVRVYVVQQPSSSATTAVALVQQPVVGILDASGNLVQQAGVLVTATVDIGTISGSVTALTNAAGFAIFTTLTFDVAAGVPFGSRTLTFASAGLASATATVTVSDAGASDIAALVAIGNCEILIDAKSGVVGDGVHATGVTDLSGKNRTLTMPDGNVPFTPTQWDAATPAFRFTAAVKRRILINSGTGVPPYPVAIPVPISVVSVLDGLINTGHTPNLYRDNVFKSVGYVDAGGQWAMFDGTVWDTTFNVSALTGKVIRIDVHDGAASVMAATDAELTGDTGVGSGGIGQYYVGGESANTSPLEATQAMHILYSKHLSLAERNLIRQIIKARYPGIAPAPTLGHGPILSTNSVIDGVTVTMQLGVFTGANFSSTDLYLHQIVLRFSSALRKFAVTQLTGEFDLTAGTANGATIIACDDYVNGAPVNWHAATTFSDFVNAPGEREAVQYDPGFSCVVIRNFAINLATFGFLKSVWTDAHFWLVGEPL